MVNSMTDKSRLAEQIVSRMKSVIGAEMDKDVAAYFDIKQASVHNWRKRGTVPYDQCVEMSVREGVSLDWLVLGERSEGRVDEALAGYQVDQDYTEVPLYDIEASAGHGAMFDNELIASWLKFRNDWLVGEGLSRGELVALRVAGDSMDGTLADGDTVLIDRSKRKPDGVFAVRFGDSLRIKRLQRLTDGSLRVSSDNEMYREEVVHPENLAQVEIIGQCFWRGGKVR